MLLSSFLLLVSVTIFEHKFDFNTTEQPVLPGSVHCTSDVSNPTPVYVVQGGEAVLQCEYESTKLIWEVYTGVILYRVAAGGAVIDSSKYSVSKNPLTGLYYILHILTVGVSDLKKYKCEAVIDGVVQYFFLKLDLLVPPSSLNIENVAPENNRLVGTEGQDLSVSCKAVGGKPAPNVALIIDEQFKVNTIQTAQHTLTTINRSYDRKTVKCEASNTGYSQNSLTDSAVIYLYLKPLPPTITRYTGSIEVTKPLDVACITTGSRPRATLQWTIGHKDVTSDAIERFNHITASDTYTVISDLTYSVGKSDNGHMLTCKAVNVAASIGVQTSITLNVSYAPTVTVTDTTYNQNEAIRTVACVPDGNPQLYTYYKWQHKSQYGVLIRELDGGTNGALTLPSIPVEDRYQDSGEYVCTAGNDIVGSNGNVEQTGSGYVIINAQPIFTNANKLTQYGEFGKNVEINVYIYSIPKYTTPRWYRDNTPVLTSTKYVVSERVAIVNDTFHGIDVQLDGYSVMLTIKNLEESDFNVSYRLKLSYDVSHTVQYSVLLESASAPRTPTNFTLVSSTDTRIVIEWIPGYNGGDEQTFNIQYRIINESKIWTTQEIPKYNRQNYTLVGLQGDTWYKLRMFAENRFDRSRVTYIQSISTMPAVEKEPQKISGLDGDVIGGVVGGVIIILVIILGILFFMRKKGVFDGRDKTKSNRDEATAADNLTNNDTYEYIEGATSNQKKKDPPNKRVETPSTKTYEVLEMKDTPNTYDDLSSRREPSKYLPSTEHYEALGQQDKPNVYDSIQNKEESEDREYVNLKF